MEERWDVLQGMQGEIEKEKGWNSPVQMSYRDRSRDGMNQIIHGDCIEVLKTLEENSVDAVVTDPPYGLSFMGKKWDYEVPSVAIWEECLRVLKPGGYLLSFAGTRTQHRMACNIEDAGFEIRDMIAWVYGSGFPKSLNIGKAIDNRRVKNFDGVRSFLKKQIKSSQITHNELLNKLGLKEGSGLITHWTTENNRSYQILPSIKQWEKLKEILKFGNDYDDDITKYEREVVGIKKSLALPISQEIKGWGEKKDYDITLPATEQAKQWEGWGTALKPALEPITVARKPLSEKSVAENVLKWGTGGINIDGSRVGTEVLPEQKAGQALIGTFERENMVTPERTGRFPANFIHDGSDEVVSLFPNTKSGSRKAQPQKEGSWNAVGIKFRDTFACEGSEGSASRFFYCAKASKAERNMGCEGLEEKNIDYGERKGQNNSPIRPDGSERKPNISNNNHPTVKPIALMEYLVKLVTKEGVLVLDPFAGSGSTLIACKSLKRNYIGIEKEEEYLKIAEARLKDPDNLFTKVVEYKQ